MRTFIAINLNPDLKDTLANLVARLEKKGGHVKWVNQESMHLTLKFLGEIDENTALKIEDVLKRISGHTKPFILSLRGAGYFPQDRRNPRVLWIGLSEEKALIALEEELEAELEKLGFSREKRKFHPHLTLGRVKSAAGIAEIIDALERERETNFGEMTVKRITFFQSILKPSGAEYLIISEFEFK